ncbi:MAG: hypothetical protein WBX14_10595 [Candidatus Udaeobacter sp.]
MGRLGTGYDSLTDVGSTTLPTESDPRKIIVLISDALSSNRLRYGGPNAASNAVDYAKFFTRSHPAVIHVYDAALNVIETYEARGRFQKAVSFSLAARRTSR